jgi:hypothetical protein
MSEPIFDLLSSNSTSSDETICLSGAGAPMMLFQRELPELRDQDIKPRLM